MSSEEQSIVRTLGWGLSQNVLLLPPEVTLEGVCLKNHFHKKQKVTEAVLQSLTSALDLEVRKLSPMEAEEEEFYDKRPLKGSTSGESPGSQGLSKGKG